MTAAFTRAEKRAAALKEAGMRRRVYGRWADEGRMTAEERDRGIAVMEAIAADYAEPDLFAAPAAGLSHEGGGT